MKKAVGRPEKQLPQNEAITSAKLATQYGVGKTTIERDGQFARAVDVVKEADAGFHPS